MLKQRIEQDLKTALLAGDTLQVSVLRSLKSAITYVEVAKGLKATGGLSEEQVVEVLAKEAKKRQESAQFYETAGESERAASELREKNMIDHYLPKPLSKEDIETLVDQIIEENGSLESQSIGQTIGRVKQKAGASTDGSEIAQIVKERFSK